MLKNEYFMISETTDTILQDLSLKFGKIKKKRSHNNEKISDLKENTRLKRSNSKGEKKLHSSSCPTLQKLSNSANNSPMLKRTQSAQRFTNSKKGQITDLSSLLKTITDRSDEKLKMSLLSCVESDPCKAEIVVDSLLRRNLCSSNLLEVINMNKLNIYLCANSRNTYHQLFLQHLSDFLIHKEEISEEEKKCQILRMFFKDLNCERVLKRENIQEILMGLMLKTIDLLDDIQKNEDLIKKKIDLILILQIYLNKNAVNEKVLFKERDSIFYKIKEFIKDAHEDENKTEEKIMKISQKYVEILLKTF